VTGERRFDIALFGATGFTGGLAADYLAAHGPAGLRWALVGRNRAKLEAVAQRLAASDPQAPAPELLVADASDRAALDEVVRSTRVVVTTVGPYALHGWTLVAACAAAGTDYLDLTGEPEFVDRVWLLHDAEARRSGARLIHSCGFDSVPHDLGAYFTVQRLPEGVPLKVEGFVRTDARFSGGTYHSTINAFGRAGKTMAAMRERRRLEPRGPRRVHSAPARVRRQPWLGGWSFPLPTIDPVVIRRSAAAVERYGPDFTYGHNLVARRLSTGVGLAAAFAGIALLAPIPPARRLLLKLKDPGEGPSPERRARSWFKITFVGEGGGERVVTEVSGGDPGYDETAKILAESALCVAFDELPETAGQVTTVTAMGDAFLTRLQRAGIGFRVLEPA